MTNSIMTRSPLQHLPTPSSTLKSLAMFYLPYAVEQVFGRCLLAEVDNSFPVNTTTLESFSDIIYGSTCIRFKREILIQWISESV